MRSAECGMAEIGDRNAEFGMRSAECGDRSAECGVRRPVGGGRRPECGIRNAECGLAEIGDRKAETGNRRAAVVAGISSEEPETFPGTLRTYVFDGRMRCVLQKSAQGSVADVGKGDLLGDAPGIEKLQH